MKVLFVSSGNSIDGISPIVKNQGQSLISLGVKIEFFTIRGKGLCSYLRHIFILRKYLKNNYFDAIHAHYSFSAYVALLADAKPLVVSLMGSDIMSSDFSGMLIKLLYYIRWRQVIVKSEDMYRRLGIKSAHIIPNGVDLSKFKPLDKSTCRLLIDWNLQKKHIMFAANPLRKEKNFALATRSVNLLNDDGIELHVLDNVPNEQMPLWYNACDVLLLTSFWEGSPNVIKEAMATNCPLVATDVGDIKWVTGTTEGCYISTFDREDVASKINMALLFAQKKGRTNGRERIIKLCLDSDSIAKQILSIYNLILGKKIY